MEYWTVVLIASVVISYQLHVTESKFSFAVPGKWGNHKRVPFTFSLPGKWGDNIKRSADRYSTCDDEPNPEAIKAIYEILQAEALRINACLLQQVNVNPQQETYTKRSTR